MERKYVQAGKRDVGGTGKGVVIKGRGICIWWCTDLCCPLIVDLLEFLQVCKGANETLQLKHGQQRQESVIHTASLPL